MRSFAGSANKTVFRWLLLVMYGFPAERLVAEAAMGSESARDELLLSLWPVAYKAARCFGADNPSAEDAAQQACLRVALRITSLKNPGAFQAWFLKILVRILRRDFRRNSSSRNHISYPEAQLFTESMESEVILHLAIAELPHALRESLLLIAAFGYSSDEAASILGRPAGTVRYQVYKARETLRGVLFSKKSEHEAKNATAYSRLKKRGVG